MTLYVGFLPSKVVVQISVAHKNKETEGVGVELLWCWEGSYYIVYGQLGFLHISLSILVLVLLQQQKKSKEIIGRLLNRI